MKYEHEVTIKHSDGRTESWGKPEAREANTDLAAARHDQLLALVLYGWTVERRSLYDEENIEGWAWIEPNGTEHAETGDWNKLPPWPDTARAALAKAKGRDG